VSAPEESSTIQSIRTAHRHLRKVVHRGGFSSLLSSLLLRNPSGS
jgi:hypothetical protein